jgi:GxxExxY protein
MKTDFLYGDITGDVIGSFYKIHRRVNVDGLKEPALTRALAAELELRGRKTRREVAVTHRYKSKVIGSGRIDLLVEGKVAVEIKKLKGLRSKDEAQLRAYMQDGKYAVGILLNFSRENAQTRRLDEPQFAPKK